MATEPSAAEFVRASIMASIAEDKRRPLAESTGPIPADAPRATPSRFNLMIPLTNDRMLVHNTMTGAFSLWDAEDLAHYEAIESGDVPIHAPHMRDFAYGGYVVPHTENEIATLENRYNGARFDASSLTITVAPTLDCNFGCDYCFQGLDKPHGLMQQDVQDAFIERVAERVKTLKRLHVAWYGGEPLIGRNVVYSLSERIMAVCKEAGCQYTGFIVTNGFGLTREVAERLYEYKVTSCQVTLDGPAAYHDQRRNLLNGKPTYQRIVENLREVVDHVPMVINIRVNVDSRNIYEIKGLIDDLAERGFAGRSNFGLYFAPVEAITKPCQGCNNVTMGKNTYGELEVDLYRYAFEKGLTGLPKPPQFHGMCQAIRPDDYLLTPNGNIHKCWDTVHDDDMAVGTIFDHASIPSNPLFKQWVQWSPFANDTCSNCKILPNCAGACAFKFIHSDQTVGEAGALPCPSWKFNINERLLFRAEKMGVITEDDIPEDARTNADYVGRNHTFDSMTGDGPLSMTPIRLGDQWAELPVQINQDAD